MMSFANLFLNLQSEWYPLNKSGNYVFITLRNGFNQGFHISAGTDIYHIYPIGYKEPNTRYTE